jgi:hypothetical protein
MASRSLGTLTLDLIAKTGGFTGPMDKAGRNSKKNSSDISKNMKAIGLAVGAMGVAAVAGFAVMVKSAINASDEMIKLSRSIGLPVETLSELNHSATLSGVSLDNLGKGVKAFQRNVSEAFLEGVGPGADAFADLGIALTGVDGQLKNTDVLIGEVADRFAILEDGAIKTALAQELFGKSGAGMINMLNGGSKALRENAEEAKRLGLVIGRDAAENAERFNDNMTRLQLSLKGVALQVANEVSPELAKMTEIFADPEVQTGIAKIAGGIVNVGTAAVEAISAISQFTTLIAEASNAIFSDSWDENMDQRQQRLTGLVGTIVSLRDTLSSPVFEKMFSVVKLPLTILEQFQPEVFAQFDEASNTFWKNFAKGAEDSAAAAGGAVAGLAAVKEGVIELTAEEIVRQRLKREEKELQDKIRAAAVVKFEETEAALLREIALYGEKGKLAAYLYDVEQGAYADLNPAQKETLKNLYAQADALDAAAAAGTESARAVRELSNANTSAAQSAQSLQTMYSNAASGIADVGGNVIDELVTDAGGGFEDIGDDFQRMLTRMARDALLTPILLNVQNALGGGGGGATNTAADYTGDAYSSWVADQNAAGGAESGGSGGAGSLLGSIGAGGVYAAAAVAVVAAVGVWNSKQDAKFEKMTAEYRQGNQSTGTLLGDANKKSESIGNALQEMAAIGSDTLSVNHGMYRALVDIRAGIVGVSAGFARTFALGGGGDYSQYDLGKSAVISSGAIESKNINSLIYGAADALNLNNNVTDFLYQFHNEVFNKLNKELFNTKTNVIDSGIEFLGGQLGDLLTGGLISALTYADITTEKKLLGVSMGKKLRTENAALDDIFLGQLTDVFIGAGAALQEASGVFGIEFDKYLEQLLIDPQKLSLKDLDSEGLTAEIEAFFSSTLDGWAEVLLSGTDVLMQFQVAGEGAFETMLRLASQTNSVVQALGFVGQSLGEAGLNSVMGAQRLAEFAGGFDALNSSLSSYYDKFFTEEEKLVDLRGRLGDATAGLLDVLPGTREEFRAIVGALDLTTEAGAEMFARLVGLSPAFDAYFSAMEKQEGALGSAADTVEALGNFMENFIDRVAKNGLTDFQAALYDLEKGLNDAIASAIKLGATEEDLAVIRQASALDLLDLQRGQTDQALDALRKSLDAEAANENSNYATAAAALAAEFDARVSSLDGWLDAQLNHFERRANTLGDSISMLSDLSGSLDGALGALRINSFELDKQRFTSATSQLASLAAGVNAGGALPSADLINSLTNNLSGGEDYFSTFEEYALASALALQDVAQLKSVTDEQLSTDEQMLEAIEQREQTSRDNHARMIEQLQKNREEEQAALDAVHAENLEKLQQQYQAFVDQINVLRGIDTSVQSVNEAVAVMQGAIASELLALRNTDVSQFDDIYSALSQIAKWVQESAEIERLNRLDAIEDAA